MSRRIGLLICLAVALTACGRAVKAPRERFDAIPVAVEIPWLQFATLPDRLTDLLAIEYPTNDSCGEAVRVARARRATIERANCDRAESRGLASNTPTTECSK